LKIIFKTNILRRKNKNYSKDVLYSSLVSIARGAGSYSHNSILQATVTPALMAAPGLGSLF